MQQLAISATRSVLALLMSLAPALAWSAPDLWGVDEDDGQIFKIEDYDGTPTFVDYGPLQFDDAGVISPIGVDIEAATLGPDGTLFMAYDRDLLGFVAPVLLTFNINDASLIDPNVANVVGTIGIPFDSAAEDNVSGLSIDPLTGKLWAVLKDADNFDNESEVDELWEIPDPNNNPLSAFKLGDLSGPSGQVIQAEDLEFGADGTLFVSDDRSKLTALPGALWEIDLMRDASNDVVQIDDILKLLDLDGITGTTDKFEALGWDFENNRLIGSDDDADKFALLVGPGAVADLGELGAGLTDVEGIDFVPEGVGPPPVPEPPTPALFALLLATLALVRQNRAF